MKKLLILLLLVSLSGCVSYYYPETAFEDGVYYAEDDPSYVVYSGGYAGYGYYPWSSLDCFYFGYYSHGCYSYYSRPYYYYYDPFYPVWRTHYRHRMFHDDYLYAQKKNHRHKNKDRYAGVNDPGPNDRDEDGDYPIERPGEVVKDREQGGSPVIHHRYVSTPPAGYSGGRGMVFRSKASTKVGKSYLESGKSGNAKSARYAAGSSGTSSRSVSSGSGKQSRSASSSSGQRSSSSSSRRSSGSNSSRSKEEK
jgi:hypothetical protein